MKPEVSLPQSGPEQQPTIHNERLEHAPQVTSPELGGVETGSERREQTADAQAVAAGAAAPLHLPLPVITTDEDNVTNTTSVSPLVAADEDVIEKEWVDRAKKIVSDTKDDPYQREKAVSQLQVDYLKKRYGREPGAAN